LPSFVQHRSYDTAIDKIENAIAYKRMCKFIKEKDPSREESVLGVDVMNVIREVSNSMVKPKKFYMFSQKMHDFRVEKLKNSNRYSTSITYHDGKLHNDP
jgi:hypothetical protein